MRTKILILKNKYIVRRKYVHMRTRRRTINHIGLTDMDSLINLFNKRFDQRLPPKNIIFNDDSARNNTFFPKKVCPKTWMGTSEV